MPYPKHWLVAFGGSLGDATNKIGDSWQCTIRIGNVSALGGGGDIVPADYLVNQAKPAIEGWITSTGSPWSSYGAVEYIKCNEIDANGHYKDQQNSHRYDYAAASPFRSSNAPVTFDPTAALAITWTTANARGPAHAGRMYVPMPSKALGPTGRFSSATLTNMLAGAKAFIQALQVSGAATDPHAPCVVSPLGGSSGTKLEIQGVRIGDVLDHQLRRRNALREGYVSSLI